MAGQGGYSGQKSKSTRLNTCTLLPTMHSGAWCGELRNTGKLRKQMWEMHRVRDEHPKTRPRARLAPPSSQSSLRDFLWLSARFLPGLCKYQLSEAVLFKVPPYPLWTFPFPLLFLTLISFPSIFSALLPSKIPKRHFYVPCSFFI